MEFYEEPRHFTWKINVAKKKKSKRISFYRADKIIGHKTQNGVGIIGKLRKKRK